MAPAALKTSPLVLLRRWLADFFNAPLEKKPRSAGL
jgi:hypothetical protein